MSKHYFKIIVLYILTTILNPNSGYSQLKKRVIDIQSFGVTVKTKEESDQEKYQRWKKINNAFFYCIKNRIDLYFPKGIYDVGERNFPFRSELGETQLLDCRNITIYGDGENTVFMTSSYNGADVLQLNMIKNLTIKDVSITSKQYTYNNSGSNGISITYGWDNISLKNIKCFNLPGVDKGDWVDGGKALTIQFDKDISAKKGSIFAENIISLNNAYGFRFDGAYVDEILRWNPKIVIDIEVIRAFQGISIAFGSPLKQYNKRDRLKMKINAKLVDCQQSIIMARVIGGNYNFIVDRTISYENVFNDEKGKRWVSTNSDSAFTFLGQAPKNIKFNLKGNTGVVNCKLWFGAVGNIQEPFDYKNRTENSDFIIDLKGSSLKEDIRLIEDQNKNSFFNTNIILNKDLISKENPFLKMSTKQKINILTH